MRPARVDYQYERLGVANLFMLFEPLSGRNEVCVTERARRLCEKLEIHSTPKHGAWLNMAEIALSVLARQCLDRRIGSMEEMKREVKAWTEQYGCKLKVDWRLTPADARIKLKHLYPSIKSC